MPSYRLPTKLDSLGMRSADELVDAIRTLSSVELLLFSFQSTTLHKFLVTFNTRTKNHVSFEVKTWVAKINN